MRAWSELLYDRERFLEAKMRGVRLDANTIESEYIETAQPFLRFLRHDLEIRDVCEVVKTICDDRQLAVNDLERRHFNIRPDAKRASQASPYAISAAEARRRYVRAQKMYLKIRRRSTQAGSFA